MSLRTKLLAAIVGLPAVILLVALMLFAGAAPPTPPEAIDKLIKTADGAERIWVGLRIQEMVQAGDFGQIYVVRAPSPSEPLEHPAEIWTAGAWYAEDRTYVPDVLDAKLRTRLLKRFEQVHGSPLSFVLRRDYVAVKARATDRGERSYGFVAKLRSGRAAAQAVYWVMLGGIALMMIVSFWLVSRLVIRPLALLSGAADRIADGDYRVEIDPPDSGDEFGRTIRALNRMACEIAEYQGHLEDRVMTALSRIKKAEQHLAIAQRLAATGKLASGLAHEINNPLGGMMNAVRSLARGDLDAERTGLYKSLALAMHRIEKKHIHVERHLAAAGEVLVFGDPNELQQVALNLILNAVDSIQEGSEGRIDLEVERLASEAVLRVRDNGAGISPEDQDRCYDMFFTTKPVGEGSGMGLAVVHNIVTNHGGRIELTSRLGMGTTFEVFLPAESHPAADPGPQEGAEAPPEQQRQGAF